MNSQEALAVDSKELLLRFLQNHRNLAKKGYVRDIDYVSVNADFKIVTIKFKDEEKK